jgi:hypothetical protein
VYAAVISYLYADVTLGDAEQCLVTLKMLRRMPYVASHVRKLSVVPKAVGSRYYSDSKPAQVSTAVNALASSKYLAALTKFEWNGDEM